jgi:hypothetical protein
MKEVEELMPQKKNFESNYTQSYDNVLNQTNADTFNVARVMNNFLETIF